MNVEKFSSISEYVPSQYFILTWLDSYLHDSYLQVHIISILLYMSYTNNFEYNTNIFLV